MLTRNSAGYRTGFPGHTSSYERQVLNILADIDLNPAGMVLLMRSTSAGPTRSQLFIMGVPIHLLLRGQPICWGKVLPMRRC